MLVNQIPQIFAIFECLQIISKSFMVPAIMLIFQLDSSYQCYPLKTSFHF